MRLQLKSHWQSSASSSTFDRMDTPLKAAYETDCMSPRRVCGCWNIDGTPGITIDYWISKDIAMDPRLTHTLDLATGRHVDAPKILHFHTPTCVSNFVLLTLTTYANHSQRSCTSRIIVIRYPTHGHTLF